MNEEREEKGGNDGPIKIPEEVYKQIVGKRESLLEKLGIVDQFPEDVIEEAKGWADGNKEEVSLELENRRDLRELTTWTTDPASAQDFDDALSITEEEKGYRIWVYIADVTHYVTPDTKTWKLAMERGNSTYMSGHTIHMLPRYLAEDVCSLVPGEDRLAHTVEMYINRDTLSYESIDIYKSVIRSDERLTYRECEKRLENPDLPLHKECKTICEVTERLQKQRKDAAAIYIEQGRTDLAQDEIAQTKVLEKFLPQQMTKEELESAITLIIEKVGALGPSDMGKVMGLTSKELAGKAEGRLIAETVKSLLNK